LNVSPSYNCPKHYFSFPPFVFYVKWLFSQNFFDFFFTLIFSEFLQIICAFPRPTFDLINHVRQNSLRLCGLFNVQAISSLYFAPFLCFKLIMNDDIQNRLIRSEFFHIRKIFFEGIITALDQRSGSCQAIN
jgi:hypothetical protein